jgi:hypothetical protein
VHHPGPHRPRHRRQPCGQQLGLTPGDHRPAPAEGGEDLARDLPRRQCRPHAHPRRVGEAGLDRPGRHEEDVDTCRAQLDGERLGEGVDTSLRRRVVRLQRQALTGDDRAEEHEAAPPALDEADPERARELRRGGDVDGGHPPVHLVVAGEERAEAAEAGRRDDQPDVEVQCQVADPADPESVDAVNRRVR